MRVVSWNCNGAFRNKFKSILSLNADIYVIQECENPILTNSNEYKEFASQHLWIGDNKNKGLGIFTKQNIQLQKLNWSNTYKDHTVKYFLPCRINNSFNLLGVWTHKNNSPNFGYIGQFWKYLEVNLVNFNDILIAGDFNSNTCWDEWDRWWNHSDIVKILNKRNIQSLYHLFNKEEQGKENSPTFYLQKNRSKPYHIDYIFGSEIFYNRLKKLSIGDINNWIHLSDHVPIITDFQGSFVVGTN